MNGCSINTTHYKFSVCLFIIIFFLVVSGAVYSQISVPGVPESFSLSQKKNVALPEKMLRTIDIEGLLKEDFDQGISNRYSVVQDLNINLRDSSLRTEIPGKGYIWQYKLRTENAFSLGILFKTYHLPEGASVFIYTPDHSQVLGAFTSLNNNPLSILAIAELKKNSAVIEYFEPCFPDFPGELILGSVSLAYRDIFMIFAGPGRIGINCPEGQAWQDDKRAVCRITFRDVGGGYYSLFHVGKSLCRQRIFRRNNDRLF
jgi:lysyl endopeptidase